jgi:hypothetical protein
MQWTRIEPKIELPPLLGVFRIINQQNRPIRGLVFDFYPLGVIRHSSLHIALGNQPLTHPQDSAHNNEVGSALL